MTAYDIIGDVHGTADKLEALLAALGYVDRRRRPPARRHQAVFVGDLIDRGDGQVQVVELVRAMHEAGSAQVVLGNHEFNALVLATPHPGRPGDFAPHPPGPPRRPQPPPAPGLPRPVRSRDPPSTVDTSPGSGRCPSSSTSVGSGSPTPAGTRPRWPSSTSGCQPGSPLTDAFVLEANTRGTEAFDAVDVVLKGPELRLADDLALRRPRGDRPRARPASGGGTTSATSLRDAGRGARRAPGRSTARRTRACPTCPSDGADDFRYPDRRARLLRPLLVHRARPARPAATPSASTTARSAPRPPAGRLPLGRRVGPHRRPLRRRHRRRVAGRARPGGQVPREDDPRARGRQLLGPRHQVLEPVLVEDRQQLGHCRRPWPARRRPGRPAWPASRAPGPRRRSRAGGSSRPPGRTGRPRRR